MPNVSVIIPVYNVERYLSQCLDSVICQTLKDIEIICIDDGSTDNSGRILDDYSQKDSRICIIHKENTGYGNSMNIGLSYAVGEYIAIVESDDFVELDMLEKLYNAAIFNGAEIVKANHYDYRAGKDIYYNRIQDFPKYQLFNTEVCPQLMNIADTIWTCLYKREFLLKNHIIFHETQGASFQDISFALQGWIYATKVWFIEDAVLHYRNDNPNSSMYNPDKVFCVFDEYEWLEQKFDDLWKEKAELEKYFVASKYRDYFNHYYRVTIHYQYVLLLRLLSSLEKDVERQRICETAFLTDVWKKLVEVRNDKNKFFIKTAKSVKDVRLSFCCFKNEELYIRTITRSLCTYQQIIIYGAGVVGRKLADYLLTQGINITYFAVTKSDNTEETYKGISIKELNKLVYIAETCVVIIAVTEEKQYELYQNLEKYGFKNIFRVDAIFKEYLEMSCDTTE